MPANLPLERTSFVGRTRELTELGRLVGEAAIVTVVGTGGVGKTRLALQAARRLADRFPAGTWLADLGPIGSADLVVTEVARLAGVLPGSGDPVQLLAEQLGDRRVLLLLDNCEHLVEAVALLAHRLVTACPNLRVLATSREPLAVGPEVTLELPPLETGEAVRLFVDRATAVDPAFAATDADGPLIERLCGRLDSIPLAIELAAPWVRLFSPAELLPRLADRFELLAGAPAEEVLRRLRPYGSRVRPLVVGLDGTEAPDGLEVVRDLTGETHRKYQGNRCHLVRPDGHLAASGADAIQAYLTRVYGTRPRGAAGRAGREVRPASPN